VYLEQRWPRRQTLARFRENARRIAHRTKTSFESAVQTLLRELSDEDLESLAAEAASIAFGNDTAARDEVKLRAMEEVAKEQDWSRYRRE
jgi:cytochrome c553